MHKEAETIATLANQIVLRTPRTYKNVVLCSPDPPTCIAVLQEGLGRRLYCSVAGEVWGGDYTAALQGRSGEETILQRCGGGLGRRLGERIWHTQYAPLHVIRFKSRVVIHHVVMCGGDGTLANMLADEEEIVPADRKKHISATRIVYQARPSLTLQKSERRFSRCY